MSNMPLPTQSVPPVAPEAETKRPWYKKKRVIIPVGAVILISLLSSCGGGDDDSDASSSSSSSSVTSSVEPAVEEKPAEPEVKTVALPDVYGKTFDEAKSMVEKAGLTVGETTNPGDWIVVLAVVIEDPEADLDALPEGTKVSLGTEKPEPQMTLSQKNAVGEAESYLRYTSFSRSGLIGQLEYEGYSTEDATFAVDNITVDWNEQAAKEAQSYLDYTSFSRQGLYDQLEYEGYTPDQINAGLAAVGY